MATVGIFEVAAGVFVGTTLSSVALGLSLYAVTAYKKHKAVTENMDKWNELVAQIRAENAENEGTEK